MSAQKKTAHPKESLMVRMISRIEKAGNRLPHPFMIFVGLIIITIILSFALSLAGSSATHPVTGKEVAVKNLLSKEGIVWVFMNLYKNFAAYPALGLVITMLLGVGVAESTGLIGAFMKKFIMKAPEKLLVSAIILVGICGNIASDVAVVLIPPLAGSIFYAAKRNPLVGVVAGYAAATAGFTANLLVAGTDVLLAGISTPAAQFIDPTYQVLPTANYYFMIMSTLVMTVLGTWITIRWVEKQAGPYIKPADIELEDVGSYDLTAEEQRGLKKAGIASILFVIVTLILVVPSWAPFRDANGTITPFLKSLVAFLFAWFLIIGVVFGKETGVIKSSADVPALMAKAVKGIASAIVLFFISAQFMALFNWSNLGSVLSVSLGGWLKSMNMGGIGFIILVIFITMLINIFIGSSSAKWAILAPILVPLFMTLDYSPEFAQLAYRIGDSTTNAISPVSPYFVMALGFMQRYDKNASMGSLIAWGVPYSMFYALAWIIMIVIWFLFRIPLGPGVGVFL